MPFYNEEENLKILLPKIVKIINRIKKNKIEIFLVDDCSKDNSYNFCKKFIKKQKKTKIKLLKLKKRGKQTGAIKRAIEYIKSDYIISNPFTVDGISDNRSFFLPEKIQKMAQAFDYSNFSPRKGKYKAKWELFRNYEMLYQKICKKFKFDGWSAVVFSDQVSDDSLKEIAIIDAASKMNLFKCDTNGNYCMPASEYIKLKKKKKKKRKSGSESGRKRKKSYVPKPPSFKNKNKKKLHSHRIFHQSKKI